MSPAITIRSTRVEDLHELRRCILGWRDLEVPPDHQRDARHFAAFVDGGHVVGSASCGRVPYPTDAHDDPDAVRFWGVAVLQPFQRRGIGRLLVDRLVERATETGSQLLWANARESAVPYYLDLGFEVEGEPFTDVLSGLTDRRVLRRLP